MVGLLPAQLIQQADYQVPLPLPGAAAGDDGIIGSDSLEPIELDRQQSDASASAYSSLITALKDSGAHYARIYLEWDQIEPLAPEPGQPPSYNWSWFDSQLALLAGLPQKRLRTLLKL